MKNIKKEITKFAKKQGFDLVGFSPAKIDENSYAEYEKWLKLKYEADMSYMSKEDAITKRKSAESVLLSAKTVISMAVNYYHDQSPLKSGEGRVARYAFGRDYHKILKSWLKKIEAFIWAEFGAKTISYVDTGPVLERSFAAKSGLGLIGKNRCLITKDFGSFVFLGEIITDLEIAKKSDAALLHPACESCEKCMKACPTKALTNDGINSKKCLSYLTIEHKGRVQKKEMEAIKKTRRIFGCDICQEVCPLNKVAKQNKSFSSKIAGDSLSIDSVIGIKTDEEFLSKFAGSPLMRAKRKGLRRTAKIISSGN